MYRGAHRGMHIGMYRGTHRGTYRQANEETHRGNNERDTDIDVQGGTEGGTLVVDNLINRLKDSTCAFAVCDQLQSLFLLFGERCIAIGGPAFGFGKSDFG